MPIGISTQWSKTLVFGSVVRHRRGLTRSSEKWWRLRWIKRRLERLIQVKEPLSLSLSLS